LDTELKDIDGIRAACDHLNLPAPEEGTFQLFSESVSGLGIKLPGWKYPIVVDLKTGKVKFDNYNGTWGKAEELNNFQNRYLAATTIAMARRRGLSVKEVEESAGVVRLKVRGMV